MNTQNKRAIAALLIASGVLTCVVIVVTLGEFGAAFWLLRTFKD